MNFCFSRLCLVLSLGSCLALAQSPPTERQPISHDHWSKLQAGDIVFIRSRTANAPMIAQLSNINAASDAEDIFTHCGILFKDQHGELKVYEGEGRGAGNWLTLLEWQRRESKGKVNGVEKSDLHHVYAMRWNGQPPLANALDKVLAKAKALHDTNYDNGFSWTDDRAYCSELVWKAFAAGGFNLGNLPAMSKYADVVPGIKIELEKAKDTYRNGNGYDPNESAVSPEDIFTSHFLTPVTDASR